MILDQFAGFAEHTEERQYGSDAGGLEHGHDGGHDQDQDAAAFFPGVQEREYLADGIDHGD
ncbi:MAG: hypothetical protein U5P41_09080 [Gammaproteobacteria bacterium]|nr:hypothetical protein [Gammaproteobacteria bacterium]